ncbi:RHS repeat-associated core domain-containing protein, partial [Escherichia coli]|nr:RHS repeat protein [Escherichia coli]
SLWLVRGGVAKLDEGHRLAALWQALPEELRLSPHRYLATNSPQGPWWLLGWCERVPEADEVLPAPLPPYRVLTGLVDRFGRTQTFHREAAGEFSGEITGVTDGAGRHFRLVLTTQAQRAEEARQQAISGGTEPSAFPDTLPGYTEYGRDNGIRLSAVWLTHDPEYPENLPAAPLVRYGWTPRGELAVVYDRSGKQVRSFTYDDKYRGRMVAHRHPELHPDSTLSMWPDNRIARDAHYLYRYDRYGRLTEKTDLIPEGGIRTDDERTHRYHYDSQHRLVHYTRTQYAEPLVESRYLYDPLGRRVAKRVWRRERDLTGWMSLSRKPQVTWYGWDGDRLTTIQNDRSRIQTIYQPGSFTPLIRVETATGEQAKTQRRSLADTLQQSGGEDGGSVVFPPVLVQMLDRLESEILADRVSEESRRWLASCGLTVEQMQNQMDPVYTPARKIHLYHCDHRGLPLALVSTEGATEWCAEYDEWGNLLNEENPHQLQQLIRLPGQQYDEESGLYYNRHRYYDPLQGRYITQDPIGLKGGWNFYQYPLNPVQYIDSMGLASKYGHLNNGGYGARPNKPPTPDPSKLPDIAKQLRLPYPIDQASSAPNVFKTFFRALSPYDYTLYCRKWVKPNLTCTPQDDSQYPGMDTKTASDYLPQTNWPTTQLPPGYTCAEPYLFPDINKPDGPATAGIDDLGEILAKMKQRTSRGIRK